MLLFIHFHLLQVHLLLVGPLLVLQQGNILLFNLLELGVLVLKLLTFGSERDHFLFLFLKIFLLLLELLLVIILILIEFAHLLLLLLHEVFVILQFKFQLLDFVLLLLELRLDRIVLRFRHTHRLLNQFQILNKLIILIIHLLDPALQICLLVINDLLVLKQLVSL